MIHISPKAPHYKILQLPLSSFSNCLPFKKKKVKKQISLTSNPDTSPHSEVRYAKTAPIARESSLEKQSRGKSIKRYLSDVTNKMFKRTYSENSPTSSFTHNVMSKTEEYLSMPLEDLHGEINSLKDNILHHIGTEYSLPEHIDSQTIEKILEDYLFLHLKHPSHTSSEHEISPHIEYKDSTKKFLENFKKRNECAIDTNIEEYFYDLHSDCKNFLFTHTILNLKHIFPDIKSETDIANIIAHDALFLDNFKQNNPNHSIVQNDTQEEITNKIANFLKNNPDEALLYYGERTSHIQATSPSPRETFLIDADTINAILDVNPNLTVKLSPSRLTQMQTAFPAAEDELDVAHIVMQNESFYNLLEYSYTEHSIAKEDTKEDMTNKIAKFLRNNPDEAIEFYEDIASMRQSDTAQPNTTSFRGSLSFRNLPLHNLQDPSEQHTIPENITPSNLEIQSHLAKIRDYKKEIFPQDDTPEHIVHTILDNESMKDILLSLYKQHNPNMPLSDKDIVTDVIYNPEKHSGINLKFHALLSLKQQLESLTSEKPKRLASLISKKPTKLEKLQKHIIDPTRELSEKNINIYSRLLKASEDIGMSSDSFNDILKSPEKLSVYIKDKYTVESNFPVLPITTQHEILSPEPIKEEASASSQPTKTLSHSQTFPVSHHKKTLTLSQSFPEITSITEIEEETSSAKDDTHEFKPQDMFHRVWGKNLKAIEDKVQKTQTSPLQKLQSFKNLQSFTCGLLKPQTQESESSSDMEDFSLNVSEHTYDTHDTSNKRSFSANTEEIEKFKKLKNIYDAIHNTPEFQEDYKKRQEARDAVALKERKDPNPLYYNQIIAQNAQNKKLLTRPKDNIIFQPQMTLETHHEDEENDDGFSLEALTSMLQTKRTPTESNSNIAQEYSFPVSENDELVIYTYEDRSFIKIDSNAAFRNIENIVKNNVFNHRTMKDIFDNIMKSEDFIQTIKHSPATLFKDTPIVSDIALKDTLVNYIAQNTSLTHHVIREINSFLSDEKNMEHFLIAFSVPVARMNQDITIPYLKIPHKNKTATGIKHTGDNTQGHVILEALQAVEENITQEKGKEKVES